MRHFCFLLAAIKTLFFFSPFAHGQNWTLTSAPTNSWSAVACSSDGSFVVATVAGGGIYVSTNSGSNWTKSSAPTTNWSSVACSTNGLIVVSSINGGGIWTSFDSGNTWAPSMAPTNGWAGVALSSDGSKGVATGTFGIWTSTNYGSAWILSQSNVVNGAACASSADGEEITVAQNDFGYIWFSPDAGNTWADTGYGNYQFITCSSDGTKIITTCSAGENVSISTNSGSSWTRYFESFGSVAISADGRTLIGIDSSSSFNISANYCLTWEPLYGPQGSWTNSAIAIVSNGTEFFVTLNGGGIYHCTFLEPFILASPNQQTIASGNPVYFTASAIASSSFSYQWEFNGTPISGQTNSTLYLSNVGYASAGYYSFIASNSFGTTSSSNAYLSVVPAILSSVTADSALTSVVLSVSVNAESNVSQVWFAYGTNTNYNFFSASTLFPSGFTSYNFSNFINGLSSYTTYHYAAIVSNSFGFVTSTDAVFQTTPKFVMVGTNLNWTSIAMSGDGHELVATSGGSNFISTNLGASFTPIGQSGSVFATSYDGSVILSLNTQNLIISTNRGLTWLTNLVPTVFKESFASSNAHTIIGTDGSYTYTTTNFGTTWNQGSFPISGPNGVAVSADGMSFFGVGSTRLNAYVFISTDFGKTWNLSVDIGSVIGGYALTSSADGSIITAGCQLLAISTNHGSSWSFSAFPPLNIYSLSLSANGKIFVGNYPGGGVCTSLNSGFNCYYANIPNGNYTVAESSDGNTFLAFNGNIYLSLPPPNQPCVLSAALDPVSETPVFSLTGESGYSYIVQGSTDLTNWYYIAAITATNGTVSFTDAVSSNYNGRFYRAYSPNH